MVSRIFLFLLFAGAAQAAELEGVKLDERVRVDGQELQLNGMAVRTRYQFFKVYVAGLYLPQKATTAQAAIDGRGPKRISITMVRDANADQFVESIDYGVRANSSEAQIAEVKAQLDALYGKIRAVKEAKKGMRIVLDYAPSRQSTTLAVDGAVQGAAMPGLEFFRALLRIWLGERPAQADLKRLLLGVEP
jgi:hypothetical protein